MNQSFRRTIKPCVVCGKNVQVIEQYDTHLSEYFTPCPPMCNKCLEEEDRRAYERIKRRNKR